jgi:hypothetical protein
MQTMPQDNGSGNGPRYGHAVCMRHTDGHLIVLWFADSEEIADEAVAKLQRYHEQQPELGNSRDHSPDEGFKRRDALNKWRLLHPVGENRSYNVAGFETLSRPFLDSTKLATLDKLP